MNKDSADLSSAQLNVCMKVSRHCSSRVDEFHWSKCALEVLRLHVQSKDSGGKRLCGAIGYPNTRTQLLLYIQVK